MVHSEEVHEARFTFVQQKMGRWAVFGKLFDGRMKGKMKISITCEKVGPFLMILFSWNIVDRGSQSSLSTMRTCGILCGLLVKITPVIGH
jgi:hypothetical protein